MNSEASRLESPYLLLSAMFIGRVMQYKQEVWIFVRRVSGQDDEYVGY